MKLIIFCLLALLSVFEVNSGPIIEFQTLVDCQPEDGDVSLFSRHLEDTGSFLTVKTRTVSYPEEGSSDAIIHCIKAVDNIAASSHKVGKIKIVSGGIGESSVVFEITSKRGDGYNYDIEIYGKKNKNG